MIFAKGVIHTQSVVVRDAERLLSRLISIVYTIIGKWMIGYA